MPARDKLVYLFTTAGFSKPTYRRGILDLLAYPLGHIERFSYRRSDIHPSVDQLLSSATERKGMVVFVDTDPGRNPTYMPLRWVSIREPVPSLGSGPAHEPEERVKFFLQIGEYVEYQTSKDFRQWHQQLTFLDAIREVEAKGPRYFVVPGENVLGRARATRQLDWENLVTAVSKSSKLSDAVFLRLDHLRLYPGDQTEVELRPYVHGARTYLLRPGQAYLLGFDIFAKQSPTPSKAKAPNVTLTCSSELVNTTKPFQSVVSGLMQQFAILSCKRTIEETRAALSAEIDEPVKDAVNTPNPVLLLEISVSRRTLRTFLALVFLGGLLVSSDKEALGVFLCSPGLWVWIAKFVGSAFLTGAAYLAFRKLPSGQG
jgi:hypothetical protein